MPGAFKAGPLDARIADDPRVVDLQQAHARDLSPALIGEPVDIIVCDVSFISLRKAPPPARPVRGSLRGEAAI